ncbi:MAG: glutathione S-transferase N-terminal domain-containing protein [Rhodobacter sp.]|nr:glutathione S-transferase N-terminal domain-containing protein [Rhodobacter sp.]
MAEPSGTPLLDEPYRILNAIRVSVMWSGLELPRDRPSAGYHSFAGHDRIVAAPESHDRHTAHAAMPTHLKSVFATLLKDDRNMIDLYTWTTPNGRKVSILLEELGVEYTPHAIDISQGEQFEADFLKIAPNNRIPAIVDRDSDVRMMESGAIMLYLAEKYGRFLPEGAERWPAIEWLMWQMGGVGPMFGQVHHFVRHNPGKSTYSEERYLKEAKRLYGVLNRRLEGRDYMVGKGRGEYSIVDMATWPWVSRYDWQQIDLHQFPHVRDWYARIAERPAVRRGYRVPKYAGDVPLP